MTSPFIFVATVEIKYKKTVYPASIPNSYAYHFIKSNLNRYCIIFKLKIAKGCFGFLSYNLLQKINNFKAFCPFSHTIPYEFFDFRIITACVNLSQIYNNVYVFKQSKSIEGNA